MHGLVLPVASDTLSGVVAGVKRRASSIVGKCKEILPSWAAKLCNIDNPLEILSAFGAIFESQDDGAYHLDAIFVSSMNV